MGAWIETPNEITRTQVRLVAPRVGAWIETETQIMRLNAEASHPVWVRGLKLSIC